MNIHPMWIEKESTGLAYEDNMRLVRCNLAIFHFRLQGPMKTGKLVD